jgi:hypothetical protein
MFKQNWSKKAALATNNRLNYQHYLFLNCSQAALQLSKEETAM